MTTPTRPILVWDLPVRVFHWLMVLCFAGAYLTAESDGLRLVHVTLGYTMAGLVGFRLVWGLIGTRYARFSEFVRGPRAVAGYLRDLFSGKARHFTGHNPAGALAILALLGLTLAVTLSGHATLNALGGEWLEDAHEAVANLMLGVVIVHIGGVLASSLLHREKLVPAMVHGRKAGAEGEGIRSGWNVVGILLLAAVLGFWWLQWQSPPAALADGVRAESHDRGHKHHDD
ncbi:cytochrome b/b6 domain-containing protein [Massilia sp. TS11]|uniref:cytochrome b/b6 domain-containing protein n=1 Tax=Massilia sp. TS11 TaxID=2908003 RepID=UPI001EDC4DE6|nr:cytochrome b/b6 domain-containing protein [Massilia sp. TS11]MCG2584330.1 cytochrome b/b6 domain-containing protein [Massilia sp. TS11]